MIVLPDAWLERWYEKDAFDQVFQLKGEVFREHVGRKTIRFSIDGTYYFAKLHFGIGWRGFDSWIWFITPLRKEVIG